MVVTEKVIKNILAYLKVHSKTREWLTREWFDEDHSGTKLPPAASRRKRRPKATVEPTPASVTTADPGATTTMDPIAFLRMAQTVIPTFDTLNQQLARELVNAITSPSNYRKP